MSCISLIFLRFGIFSEAGGRAFESHPGHHVLAGVLRRIGPGGAIDGRRNSPSRGWNEFQAIEPTYQVRIDKGQLVVSALQLSQFGKQGFEGNARFETG